MNGELLIERGCIDIVVAVLIVQAEQITKFAARIGKAAHALVSTSFWRRRQDIGMLTVVTFFRPAGHYCRNPVESVLLVLAQLPGTLVEGGQPMKLVRALGTLRAVAVRLDIRKNSEPCQWSANQHADVGTTCHFLLKRDEKPGFDCVSAIALG